MREDDLRNSSKHELEDTKNNRRHTRTANGFLVNHVHEGKVVYEKSDLIRTEHGRLTQIANKSTSGFAERQRVPPEEPLASSESLSLLQNHLAHLERHHRYGHHAKIYHVESIFPSQKTRVEETDTRYHDPYQGG